jgi:peroxiredoxin
MLGFDPGYLTMRPKIFAVLWLSAQLLCAVALSARAADIGEAAPALSGKLFTGQAFDLGQMRGKVVLVNFYSSYCSFCAYEIGNLENFYEKHHDEGFEVIVVGVDNIEDRNRVERMLGIYGLPGVMTDELEHSGFERKYPTPTAFVIDRDGVLRSRTRGAKTPSYYAENVLPLLQKK